jgi:hypothetical protein
MACHLWCEILCVGASEILPLIALGLVISFANSFFSYCPTCRARGLTDEAPHGGSKCFGCERFNIHMHERELSTNPHGCSHFTCKSCKESTPEEKQITDGVKKKPWYSVFRVIPQNC